MSQDPRAPEGSQPPPAAPESSRGEPVQPAPDGQPAEPYRAAPYSAEPYLAEPFPAGGGRRPTRARTLRAQFRPAFLGLVFSIGVILGVLGTSIHGNILVLGEPGSAAVLPWGAALALLMALAAQLWAGLRGGSVVEPALMGITVFTVATVAYLWPGPDQLMVPFSTQVMQTLPGPAIASLIWWLGSGVVALAAMILVKWILVRDSRKAAEYETGLREDHRQR